MNARILQAGAQLSSLVTQFCEEQAGELEQLAVRLARLFADGGQLLTAGTGMLQPVAQMMAAQFAYRLDFERPALPALCLGSDAVLASAMISCGDHEQLLLRHYRSLAGDGQLLLLLSHGGPQPALMRLRDELLEMDQPVVLLTGTGRDDQLYCDDISYCLHLQAGNIARRMEMMHFVGHLLCELTEQILFHK